MNEKDSEIMPYDQIDPNFFGKNNFGEVLLCLIMLLGNWGSGGEDNMWSRLVYLMPIASIMATVNIPEEIKMEGDLQSELDQLFDKHMKALRFVRNKGLDLTVNCTYPAGSNLWTIFDGILERYHLLVDIIPKNGIIVIKFKEGSSWKPKS